MNTPVEMTVLNPFTGESPEPTDTVTCTCGWCGPCDDLEYSAKRDALMCPLCGVAGWGRF